MCNEHGVCPKKMLNNRNACLAGIALFRSYCIFLTTFLVASTYPSEARSCKTLFRLRCLLV